MLDDPQPTRSAQVSDTPGFFGPTSVAWRVFSAPAAALMIAQITNLLEVPHVDFQTVLMDHDPLFPSNRKRQRNWRRAHKGGHFHDRLRRTIRVPLPIVFGDRATAIQVANRLLNYHRPMSGVGPDGSTPYNATAPDAMLFAAITIAHAGLIAYEKFAFDGQLPRRLGDAERDRYFAEMAQLAILMGVPREQVPTSAAEVAHYYRSLAPKFTYRRGWRAAQLRTGLSLLRPAGRSDLPATLADIALMASALLAVAALPTPSRRLHGLPAVSDPLLHALYISSLPLFALLEIAPLQRAVTRWYLGAEDALQLERIRTQLTR